MTAENRLTLSCAAPRRDPRRGPIEADVFFVKDELSQQ